MLDFSRLSEEQRRVVLAGDGPLLVVAGPGSGKTTTMAARIAYLVDARQIGPGSVLAITFTRAAAHALRTRLLTMLGERGQEVDVTTFHGFGLRVVRHWRQRLGFAPGSLRVCGAACAQALLREAAREVGADLDRLTWGRGNPQGHLVRMLEQYRLLAAHPTSSTASTAGAAGAALRLDVTAALPPLDHLAAAYESLLQRRRLVDYVAMLTWPVRLFRVDAAALAFCQHAYRAVLADEFQDLCVAQYTLLWLLATRHRNLVAVGDPCQSVYGWRGADPGLFERFLQDFPETQVHHLEQNFRSTGCIVTLANALGAALGVPRRLWTANPPGPQALVYRAADETDEAAFVAGEIAHLVATGGIQHLGEVAVLYRTNHQVQALQQALRRRALPYRLQDRIDPAAEVADGTATELQQERTGGRSVHGNGTRRHPDRGAPSSAHTVVTADAAAAAADGTTAADSTPTLSSEADPAPPVVLTTIHAAKGGEWRIVFVVGLEEGLLPHAHAFGQPYAGSGNMVGGVRPAAQDTSATRAGAMGGSVAGGVVEEMRVAYVAVTRPRERLYLSYCCRRLHAGGQEQRDPSRFLRLLPAQVLAPAATPVTSWSAGLPPDAAA